MVYNNYILVDRNRSVIDFSNTDTANVFIVIDGADQHLCTCIRISFRSRDVIQDGLKQRNHVFRFIVDIVSCISVSCRSKKERAVKLFVRCAQIDEKFKNFIDNFIRTCFRTVDLVDTYDNRELQCKCFFQNEFGLWHGTFKSVNKKNHSIDHLKDTFYFSTEIGMSRSVNDIDLCIFINNCSIFGKNGNSTFTFDIVGIHYSFGYFLIFTENTALF